MRCERTGQKLHSDRQAGFSLLELLIVVFILGVVAAAVVPLTSSYDGGKRLDLAAEQIVAALRYARSQALLSGKDRAVEIKTSGEVSVFEPDLAADPFGTKELLYHPLSKQPYQFNVGATPLTQGVMISNALEPFDLRSLGRKEKLIFDAGGYPMFQLAGVRYTLLSGQIDLSDGVEQRSVRVQRVTGRVWIQ